jgi:hypothetical protein
MVVVTKELQTISEPSALDKHAKVALKNQMHSLMEKKEVFCGSGSQFQVL